MAEEFLVHPVPPPVAAKVGLDVVVPFSEALPGPAEQNMVQRQPEHAPLTLARGALDPVYR